MTGYGRVETGGEKKIAVELRSVNSKQLDLTIKMPPAYYRLEVEVRRRLTALQRGKVDVQLTVKNFDAPLVASIDEAAFRAYYHQLKPLLAALGEPVPVAEILRLPEVVSAAAAEASEVEQQHALACLDKAVQAFVEFREREGAHIMADILQRVALIEALLLQVAPLEQERIEAAKERLRQALRGVGAATIDANRFEQELIYYLEKLDITEEKTRLSGHCAYFAQTAGEEAPGRKLGFIAQEMGREINTLGSKANDSRIQRIVVNMKDELEKIKEQLLNVL
jgi:uncharacterized protein (TIGR00255 family)